MSLRLIHQSNIDFYLMLMHSKWTKANTNRNFSIYCSKSQIQTHTYMYNI